MGIRFKTKNAIDIFIYSKFTTIKQSTSVEVVPKQGEQI